MHSLVVMGVSGCGKSSLAQALGKALGYPLLEGDAFHPTSNQTKMANGTPLNDTDRASWLETLGQQLADHQQGVVLSCSALKKNYRDVLRGYQPDVKFVYLNISKEEAISRVASRTHAGSHFFPAALVDNQFATLEDPTSEARVLKVEATDPIDALVAQVLDWLG